MSGQRESRIIGQWRARGQEHLFASWRRRSAEKKKALLNDLDSLNVDLYEHLLRQLHRQLSDTGQHRIEPIPPISEAEWREDEAGRRKGEELLAAGKAAFLTVAAWFRGTQGVLPNLTNQRRLDFSDFCRKTPGRTQALRSIPVLVYHDQPLESRTDPLVL